MKSANLDASVDRQKNKVEDCCTEDNAEEFRASEETRDENQGHRKSLLWKSTNSQQVKEKTDVIRDGLRKRRRNSSASSLLSEFNSESENELNVEVLKTSKTAADKPLNLSKPKSSSASVVKKSLRMEKSKLADSNRSLDVATRADEGNNNNKFGKKFLHHSMELSNKKTDYSASVEAPVRYGGATVSGSVDNADLLKSQKITRDLSTPNPDLCRDEKLEAKHRLPKEFCMETEETVDRPSASPAEMKPYPQSEKEEDFKNCFPFSGRSSYLEFCYRYQQHHQQHMHKMPAGDAPYHRGVSPKDDGGPPARSPLTEGPSLNHPMLFPAMSFDKVILLLGRKCIST